MRGSEPGIFGAYCEPCEDSGMKIDLVINSMIHQVDRATLAQAQPQGVFRPGEVLQGRVLGPAADDGSVQIRLSSGALLNAMPAEGLRLLPGDTVTLRVNAQTGPKTVMQLLSQESENRPTQAAVTLAQLQGAELTRLGMPNTKANRRLLSAMNAMGLEASRDMLTRAAQAQAGRPGLPAEQAAFLAANSLAANEQTVASLNRLLAGPGLAQQLQDLSAQLQAVAQTPDPAAQPALLAPDARAVAQPGAPQPPATQGLLPPLENMAGQLPAHMPDAAAQSALLALSTQAAAQAAGTPQQQAAQAQALVAQNPATQAVEAQANNIYDTQHGMSAGAGSFSFEGQRNAMALLQAVPAQAGQVAPSLAFPGHATEALQLQSLVQLAMGGDGAPDTALMTALDNAGLLGETVARALDGMFPRSGDVAAQARAFAALLPQDTQAQGERFFAALVHGLRAHLAEVESQAPTPAPPADARKLAMEVSRLFIRLREGEDNGARLLQAAAERRPVLERLATHAQAVAPEPVAQELRGIAESFKLAADINQYAYQQIPLQMGENARTVELYVMKRGKRRKIDPENASILIALDTEHLGRLEALIHVNRRTLRLRVGVTSAEVGEYIQTFSKDFDEAMEAIGYRMADLRMQVTQRPVTPLTAQAQAAPPARGGALNITL